jgi:hypothetical protein
LDVAFAPSVADSWAEIGKALPIRFEDIEEISYRRVADTVLLVHRARGGVANVLNSPIKNYYDPQMAKVETKGWWKNRLNDRRLEGERQGMICCFM